MQIEKNVPLPKSLVVKRAKGQQRVYRWDLLENNGESILFEIPEGHTAKSYRPNLIASFKYWAASRDDPFFIVTRSVETESGKAIRVWRVDYAD